jgi:hypothetical protein
MIPAKDGMQFSDIDLLALEPDERSKKLLRAIISSDAKDRKGVCDVGNGNKRYDIL